MYKPKTPFNVPMKLLIPEYITAYGSTKKVYPAFDEGIDINCSFRTFGGTEITSNGLLTVENTAVVETWFRPDIKSDCRLVLCETKEGFEIVGAPEDIEMRHQFLKVKLRSIGGVA